MTKSLSKLIVFIAATVLLCPGLCSQPEAQGPKREQKPLPSRYALPPSIDGKPFKFVGETIPLDRPDVRLRIRSELNLLLLDAASVLRTWLVEDGRYAWILEEVLQKEGVPTEFALLAPILSRMKRSGSKANEGGIWAVEKLCGNEHGLSMSSDDWHDDRMDIELSTRCFAAQIKALRKELSDSGWLMTVAAYMTSRQNILDLKQKWNATSFWDLPSMENAEALVPRWIAMTLINSHRSAYGLKFKPAEPLTFDQITPIVLNKDLPVSEVAKITATPARVVLELNPRIKPSAGIFGAKTAGKPYVHTIATPRGKGNTLVEKLKKEGFLEEQTK